VQAYHKLVAPPCPGRHARQDRWSRPGM